MSKPDPPTPPNPQATAAAQTGTNVSTGVANAYLNNVNQVTPTGSLTYSNSGSHQWTDPSTGQVYTIPTFTATTTQSPAGQQLQSLSDQTKINLGQMGLQQSNSLKSMLSNPLDTNFNTAGYFAANPDALQWFESGTTGFTDPTAFAKYHIQAAKDNPADGSTRTGYQSPQAGNAQNILNVPQALTSFDAGGPIQNSFGDAGNIAQSYGPTDNFSADRQRVEDSLMARINPQLNQQQDKLRQQLADQGIRYGSAAYNNAFTPYNQQANDARFAAIGQAGSEQQRMTQEAQAQAQFQNAAQQQNYEQLLGRGSFANAAQGQQFTQNSAQATFNNAGLAQQLAQQQSGFNAQNAQRNQYLQEQYAQRNQPINEITSLMSGSQVGAPGFVNTPGSQIATTDFAGITNQNFQNQMGIYNAQNQNYQQLMGGLLGLGAGALKASDRNVKANIERVGSVLAAQPDEDEPEMGTVFGDKTKELPIYRYSYKDDPSSTRHVGPMAQDVQKIDPKAVKVMAGVKHIDTRRVMGSILRAA